MADFQLVAEIRDVAGMVLARITAKQRQNGTNLYSFMFLREYEDKGERRETSWLNDRHTEAVARLVPQVLNKIKQLTDAEVPL